MGLDSDQEPSPAHWVPHTGMGMPGHLHTLHLHGLDITISSHDVSSRRRAQSSCRNNNWLLIS